MWKNNKSYSRFADSFTKMPAVMGNNVSMIQHFELKIDFLFKTEPERQWPRKLEFFVKKMTSLKRLKLTTDFDSVAVALQETSGISRAGQERRALMSFASYLVLRHPGLNLLIWPADSGPTYDANETRVRMYIELVNHRGMRKSQTVEKYENRDDETRKSYPVCLSCTASLIPSIDLSRISISTLEQFVTHPGLNCATCIQPR